MSRAPEHCKQGHTGWMKQRLWFDKDRGPDGRHYWIWRCQECERLNTQQRRQRSKEPLCNS